MEKRYHTMLSSLRRISGKTEQQVADEVGVKKATYSAWETGKAELGAERILALCISLNCSPNDILGHQGEERRFSLLTSEEEELLETLRGIPPGIRRDIAAIMRACSKGWH